MNFLVTIESGPMKGQSFQIDDARNEADAINETFKRANLNKEIVCDSSCECCFTQVRVKQL